ncbi:MAG: AAA family ATPase [Bacteroidia bacterium]
MTQAEHHIKSKNSTAINEYFISNLKDRLLGYKQFMLQLAKVFDTTGIDTINKRLNANKKVRQLISDQFEFKLRESFTDEFPSYHYAIDGILSQLPSKTTIEQTAERFTKLSTDKAPIAAAKAFKNVWQNTYWGLIKFTNIFKKQKTVTQYFNRTVPERECYRYFIKIRFGAHLLEILQNTERSILEHIATADEICRSITLNATSPINGDGKTHNSHELVELAASFERMATDVATDAQQKLDQEYKLLEYALQKVGTIELNASFFNEHLNTRREEKIDHKYANWTRRIKRNHKIIKDNWLLSHEINVFYESLQLASKRVCSRLDAKIQKHLFHQIENVNVFLMDSSLAFSEPFLDKTLLTTAIKKERSRINGAFKKELVPKSVQMMLFQNLPSVTLGLENDFKSALNAINTATATKRDFKITDQLRENELSYINPKELVNFEYFKSLRTARENLHTKLVKINNRLQPAILEISNIHAYTFETAINSIETSGASIKDVFETIKNGFERAFEKIEVLKSELSQIGNHATTELDKALGELASHLQHLNNTDNAFQLNVKLLESKARKRTKSHWQNTIGKLYKAFNWLLNLSKKLNTKWQNLYKTTEQSLSQGESSNIDSELTAFLSTATKSYEKLPFIYRLLFRLTPLEDFNFYVDRQSELSQLNKAYQKWEMGQKANVLITGPKGSGLTTLFNKFSNDLSDDIQLNQIKPKNNISDQLELIELLKLTFNQSKFTHIEDVGQYLVSCGIKRVVLIDELQRFFMRRIDGFEVLNELQKLIRITQNQVFWIVNLAEVSGNYLKKTTNFYEFFNYSIQLNALSVADVKQLIMARHRVSGYKLVYTENIAANTKKLSKLSALQKQNYLSDQFFEKLAKINFCMQQT